MPDDLLSIVVVATDLLAVAAVLTGLSFALRRACFPETRHWRVLLAVAAVVLAWYGLTTVLAMRDVFLVSAAVTFPALPVAVLVPIAVGTVVLLRSRTASAALDATPLSWLVGVQVYRVVGVIFLLLWAAGSLPGEFALPAGIGDMLTGLGAATLAPAIARGDRNTRAAAYLWNAFGLLDFVVALATGFLTSPGPFHLLALDNPNLMATAYPLAMIPTFVVPFTTLLHVLCLWKLRRMANQDVTASSADASARPVPAASP